MNKRLLTFMFAGVCVVSMTSVSANAATSNGPGAAASADDPSTQPKLHGMQTTDPDAPVTPPLANPPAAKRGPEDAETRLTPIGPTGANSDVFPGTRDPLTVAVTPTEPSEPAVPAKGKDRDLAAKVPHDVETAYSNSLKCVASQLTPLERSQSWSVGEIFDRTGQVNAIADAGTGTFSTQAGDDIMLDSLTRAGVTVVDSTDVFQKRVDWYMGKADVCLIGDGNSYNSTDRKTGKTQSVKCLRPIQGTIMPIRYLVQGAVSTLDFVPGGGVSFQAGLSGQRTHSAIRLGMTMRAVQFPVGPQLGGQIVATDRVEREVDAVESQLGFSFFHIPFYYSLTVGADKRQALQAAQVAMYDRFAAVLVAKADNITSCDAQLAYDDKVAFSAP